jgi:hypothetical protein
MIALALTLATLTAAQPLGHLYFATEVCLEPPACTQNNVVGIVSVDLANTSHPQDVVATLPSGYDLEGVMAVTGPILCESYPERGFDCIAITLSKPGFGQAATGETFLINLKTEIRNSKILFSRPSPICWSLANPIFENGLLCVEKEPKSGKNVVKRINLNPEGVTPPDVTVVEFPKKWDADFPISAFVDDGNSGDLNFTQLYHIGLTNSGTKRDSIFTLETSTAKVRETPFGDGKSLGSFRRMNENISVCVCV